MGQLRSSVREVPLDRGFRATVTATVKQGRDRCAGASGHGKVVQRPVVAVHEREATWSGWDCFASSGFFFLLKYF